MKYPDIYVGLLLALVATGCDDDSCVTVGEPCEGGILAYVLSQGDPGYDREVPHGLIAFENDNSTGIPWSNGSEIDTGATGVAIGTGAANTATIVEAQGEGVYAASLCADLEHDGYTDWYLPSEHEIQAIVPSRHAIGGFDETACYWTSTQFGPRHSWLECIDGRIASVGYYDNSDLHYVRAIRSF
ncbi:MAG: DUF1566 domain-containing protein [Deltaproteobacteria bacterium]|nr:DUF1566 domain-containing protein [Deltaproteobacteria bacterium]